ncbi:hypothetical protein RclHR1_12690002 [Rhizophagus clarus]|uniref:Uncharacterized protein n=1 Tax=Rhizophagus clarus TaxID=94130 RepID=A0A2Z6QKC8_9GLOM|nr:hypothetical protein RclHR1_12690002 [Rhizophagus clarus]
MSSDSVKFFKITYQEMNTFKLFYIKSVLKIDSLKNLLGFSGKIVCELTVTNCFSFWTRNVTLGDLKSTKPKNIRVEQEFYNNDAQFSWNWLLDESETISMPFKITLGTLSLYPVLNNDTIMMWQEWMKFFIEERNLSIIKIENFETRIEDISEINSQLNEKFESITADIRNVLNKKKRKLKKSLNLLSTIGSGGPSNNPLESQSPIFSGHNDDNHEPKLSESIEDERAEKDQEEYQEQEEKTECILINFSQANVDVVTSTKVAFWTSALAA